MTFTWGVSTSIPHVLDDGTFKYVYSLGRIAFESRAGAPLGGASC